MLFFLSFRLVDSYTIAVEINVLNAKPQAIGDSQAAPVHQLGLEEGEAGETPQQSLGFGRSQHDGQFSRLSGPFEDHVFA